MVKKYIRKTTVAFKVLQSKGFLAFLITCLQFLQKHTSKNRKLFRDRGLETGAIYEEVLLADPALPANKSWKGAKSKDKLTFNWLMPPPGKGSGGHMTLFRFIKALEDTGHTCRLYFHRPGIDSTVEAVRAAMGDSFPKLRASMEWLWPGLEMEEADGIFATSWQTAYTVYVSKVQAKKYYFVQDFEPYFYSIGSSYILAENTYKLGLRGITAGGWLESKLSRDYGMVTDSFWFGSDSEVYSFNGNLDRKEIVFYARPTTHRRAFELGVMSLDLFHKIHPDYTINFVGWDVSEYNIPFPYNNLGILTPQELNNVYNRCSASLVMSLTNMSLLPLELLSSGCIPVVTDGENNTMVSDNKYIKYAASDPIALSNALSETVGIKEIDEYSQKASISVKNLSWRESCEHFVGIVEKSVRSKGNL
jgi:hypothetical protein